MSYDVTLRDGMGYRILHDMTRFISFLDFQIVNLMVMRLSYQQNPKDPFSNKITFRIFQERDVEARFNRVWISSVLDYYFQLH